MSNVFQQIIDAVKQVFGESDSPHPMVLEQQAHFVYDEASEAHDEKSYQEAIQLYTEALKLTPNDLQVRKNRSLAYGAVPDFDSALADINYVLKNTPHDLHALLIRGNLYEGAKQYKNAIADLTYVIDVPKDIDKSGAYFIRAVCAGHVDLPLAIHDYTYLIELNGEYDLHMLYRRRGKVYEKLGDLKLALQDYESSIQKNPDYVLGYGACAAIYRQKKKFDKALTAINKQIELEPQKASHFTSRASLYFATKKFTESIADYHHALTLDPSLTGIHNMLAFAYPHLGNLDKAMEHAIIVIEQSSPRPEHFDTRAQVYWLIGDYDKALADFETATRLDNKGLYLAGQAVTTLKMDDTAKAIELWHDAIKLDETLADPTVFDEEYHYTPKYVQAIRELAEKAELASD